jgi:integrase
MIERVDLITLSNFLGHTSLDMTRRYVHMPQEHKLKAVDRIAHLGFESENGVSLLPPEPQDNGG